VPPALPAGVVLDDLQAALQSAHGAVVSPLHSYDFWPEVRAAPCLAHNNQQCYGKFAKNPPPPPPHPTHP
jgi:hypothetical protein